MQIGEKFIVFGLAKEYQKNTDVRIVLKSFVALALFPDEDTFLRFKTQGINSEDAKMKKNAEFVSYFEAIKYVQLYHLQE